MGSLTRQLRKKTPPRFPSPNQRKLKRYCEQGWGYASKLARKVSTSPAQVMRWARGHARPHWESAEVMISMGFPAHGWKTDAEE